jgi:mannosyltransferase
MAGISSDKRTFSGWLLPGFLLLVVAAGLAARLWRIASEPLWLDEAYSAYAAAKGFDFLWNIVPQYETHPPFYYSLLHVWTVIVGDHLAGLRSLGVVCGIATLAAMAMAAREIGRVSRLDGTARTLLIIFAVSLAAMMPTLVQMTREVRPYPVLILVYSIAIAAMFRTSWRIDQGGRLAGGSYWLYLFCLALALWLHNLGVLFGGALGLALLLTCYRMAWSKQDWFALIGGHLAVFLLWLPAILILVDQAPTWISSTWLNFPPSNLFNRVVMLFTVPRPLSIAAAALLLCLALLHGTRPERRRTVGALLILALAPVAVSLIVSATIAPIFISRTLTPVTVPALLLLAFGAATAQGYRRIIALGCVIALIGQAALVDVRLRQNGPQQKWYAALEWLSERYRPGDMVYAYPNEGALPFDFAVRDRALPIRTRPIPSAIPALTPPPGSWYVSGSRGVPSLDRPHLRAIAEEGASRKIPTIWLLRLGPWAYDKGDVFLQELSRERVQVGHYKDGPIDIIGLRRKEAQVRID